MGECILVVTMLFYDYANIDSDDDLKCLRVRFNGIRENNIMYLILIEILKLKWIT